MDWKQEAVDRLRSYGLRKQALEAIPRQIEEVRLRREGIGAVRTDRVAVSGGREDRMFHTLAYQQALEQRLEVTQAWVSGMEAALAALSDEERLVLDRFYIHPARGNVDRLCEELCVERASVYRRKDQALRRFTMALYGWEAL